MNDHTIWLNKIRVLSLNYKSGDKSSLFGIDLGYGFTYRFGIYGAFDCDSYLIDIYRLQDDGTVGEVTDYVVDVCLKKVGRVNVLS